MASKGLKIDTDEEDKFNPTFADDEEPKASNNEQVKEDKAKKPNLRKLAKFKG